MRGLKQLYPCDSKGKFTLFSLWPNINSPRVAVRRSVYSRCIVLVSSSTPAPLLCIGTMWEEGRCYFGLVDRKHMFYSIFRGRY